MGMRTAPIDLEPGVVVRHAGRPDWGLGRVQSVIGHRVTVGFEEIGKVTIDVRHVTLLVIGDGAPASGG